MSTSKIEWRYLRNSMILLDDRHYPIPMVNKMLPIQSSTPEGIREALQPVFDLEKAHVTDLGVLTPQVPRKKDGWSNSWYEKLVAAEEAACLERLAKAEIVLTRLRSYVKHGILEIVSDPDNLLSKDVLTDAERAAAGIKHAPEESSEGVTVSGLKAEAEALRQVRQK